MGLEAATEALAGRQRPRRHADGGGMSRMAGSTTARSRPADLVTAAPRPAGPPRARHAVRDPAPLRAAGSDPSMPLNRLRRESPSVRCALRDFRAGIGRNSHALRLGAPAGRGPHLAAASLPAPNSGRRCAACLRHRRSSAPSLRDAAACREQVHVARRPVIPVSAISSRLRRSAPERARPRWSSRGASSRQPTAHG